MAQTGFTPILIYSSSTPSQAPAVANLTNSTLGSELAINITDGKLFYKDNANAIQVIGWKTVPTTAGGTGLTSYSQGDLLYYNSGTTLTALAKNTTATRYLSNTGTNNNPAWAQINLANGVTGTLPTGNGGTGLTSFTANGVVYASSTSALATSSNLLFDGTDLSIGGDLKFLTAGKKLLNSNGRAMLNQTGGILQVVQNSTVGSSSTTSTTPVDVTNFSVTITPSSTSSKILVIASARVYYTLVAATNVVYQFVLNRGVTGLVSRHASAESGGGGLTSKDSMAVCYVDSPATTSATTYKIQHYISSASSTATCDEGWIIAMEIAG